jgi:ABC-type dipeptide/oligopeptide/nickel transport system permease component
MFYSLARRLLATLATLVAVSAITFGALAAVPGDTAVALAGDSASDTQLRDLRAELGLDRPLLFQYASFMGGVARGDLGRSFVSDKPVMHMVVERMPYTLALSLAAIALAAGLGIAVGSAAAARAGTKAETLLMGTSALAVAVPGFWSALLFMLLFSVQLRWLPVTGAGTPAHFVLPVLTLALPVAGILARVVRASVLDTLHADFVRTAHAKGLAPGQVLARHVLRNSIIPVVTMLGLHLGHLIGGAFIVETIFGWPGLGRLMIQAIFDRDYPLVLGAALVVAALFMAINLLVDLIHGRLDPQVGVEAV